MPAKDTVAYRVARAAAGRVERHLRDAAPVAADRRQGALTASPWLNHSWHVTLYVTARGLTTSPIAIGARTFQIDFDFIDHRLVIQTSDGGARDFARAAVGRGVLRALMGSKELDIQLSIHPLPNEVENPIRFDQDEVHRAYDAEYANRFWRALVQADRVFKIFRARFIGK